MKIMRNLILISLGVMLMLVMSAEKRVLGTPIRIEGGIKMKELATGVTPPTGYGYIYFDTDGIAYSVNPAGTTVALGTTDTVWGTGAVTTNITPVDADDDILLADGGVLSWGDANPGTVETTLSDISAGILMLDGGSAYSGVLRFQEDNSNGTNYIGIAPPQTVAADYTLILPATAPADKAVFYTSATSTMASDATNLSWDDTTNTNVLTLGAGTGGGTLALLEGSGGGTNTVSVTSPATLAASIEYTMPDALPTVAGTYMAVSTTGALSQVPAAQMLYASYAAAPSHAGTTAGETELVPASVEGTATIPIARLLAGAEFTWDAMLVIASDADGDETLTINVYCGTQLVGTSGAIATDGASSWVCSGHVKIKTVGATGTGVYGAMFANGVVIPTTSGAVFTNFDCTATQAFSVKAVWGGTTDANDTVLLNDVNLSYNNVN